MTESEARQLAERMTAAHNPPKPTHLAYVRCRGLDPSVITLAEVEDALAFFARVCPEALGWEKKRVVGKAE
jgi:hypothetical protein